MSDNSREVSGDSFTSQEKVIPRTGRSGRWQPSARAGRVKELSQSPTRRTKAVFQPERNEPDIAKGGELPRTLKNANELTRSDSL